jgi:hypothetical protein
MFLYTKIGERYNGAKSETGMDPVPFSRQGLLKKGDICVLIILERVRNFSKSFVSALRYFY